MKDLIRLGLFMALFGIGAGALSLAALSRDLRAFCDHRRALAQTDILLDNLRQLNDDYDALLGRLQRHPDELKRLAPVVLGQRVTEANGISPGAGIEQQMLARQALATRRGSAQLPTVPVWLDRISLAPRRRALFLSGSILVVIACVWFGQAGTQHVPGCRPGESAAGGKEKGP